MGGQIQLIIYSGDRAFDITQLVNTIKWGGRKGSSARTINVSLLDDDGYQHARSGIDVEKGMQCVFSCDGKERFRGIIMSQTQTHSKKMTFKAYDNGIYLANNKDTFTYRNVTADYVFRDCCNRFGIKMGEVAKCSYQIPELTKSKTTPFDAICNALNLDFDATGIRHFITSDKGKLNLLTRRENIMQWVIEVGQNMTSYSYTRSIERIRTRVKMISKEGTTVAEKKLAGLEEKIGIFQEIDQPKESLSAAQINDLINTLLDEKGTPERSLSIDAIGIPDVISGIGVYIIIPELGLKRTFYVDEDEHTFDDNKHTMRLKLTYVTDLDKEEKNDAGSVNRKVGDIVQFKGGNHFISSAADAPTGSPCKAGPAKITLHAPGAKHPWHLIHTDNQTRVYGWVDVGSFS